MPTITKKRGFKMNNNKSNGNKRVIPIIFIVIAILAMLPVIISLIIAFFPVFLVLLFGFLIFMLIKLLRKSKKAEVITPQEEQPQTVSTSQVEAETEESIMKKAFGLLQKRITEQLGMQYPGAKWNWVASNAFDRFKNNESLIIILSSAGGFNKAQVSVHNLVFKGIYYGNAAPQTALPANPVVKNKINISGTSENEIDDTEDIEEFDESDALGVVIMEDAPVNYGRLAFEWCDANISDINAKYNETMAQNQTEMLIPAEDLPHPDSWPDICDELKRNGFSVADFCNNGIKVNITN
jgi:hypothetical protein